MMNDLIGQQLGNYRLNRKLGVGSFGQVYRGWHVNLSRQAAVKVLLNQQNIKAFQDEARIIASLKHPHIVSVLEFDVSNGIPFLVMDYCPDGTLVQRHPIGERVPLSTVVSYVKQVADALQYAHDKKIIHRDVKPENMLIGSNGELLLSDFGIAATAHSTHSMQAQNLAGSPAYMAPEQFDLQPRCESDQYAFFLLLAWILLISIGGLRLHRCARKCQIFHLMLSK